MILLQLLGLALVAGLASAHGDVKRELSERRRFLDIHTNNLDHCAELHQSGGLDERAIQRRAERYAAMQEAAGLQGNVCRVSGVVHSDILYSETSLDRQPVPCVN